MNTKFDGRAFLDLKFNDGRLLESEDKSCGCIKGNFCKVMIGNRIGMTPDFSFYMVKPKVFTILSIAENLLYKGYVEKAKWFAFTQLSKLEDDDFEEGSNYAAETTISSFMKDRSPFKSGKFQPIVDKVKTRKVGELNYV